MKLKLIGMIPTEKEYEIANRVYDMRGGVLHFLATETGC